MELFFARKGGLLDVFSIQESIFSAGSLMVNSFVNKTLAKYRYMHVTGQLLDYIYPKNLILMNNTETTNTSNNDILESKKLSSYIIQTAGVFWKKTSTEALKQMTSFNNGISLVNNLLHSIEQFAIKFEELNVKNKNNIPLHNNMVLISNETNFYLLNRSKDPENESLIDLGDSKNKIVIDEIEISKYSFHSLKAATKDHYNFIERIKSHWFWGILWRNRSAYTQSGLASILVNVFAIATAMFTMIVYNKIIPANAIDSLIVLVSGVGVIIVVDLITRSIRSSVLNNSGIDADELIADNLFEQIVDMKTNTAKMNVGSMATTMREFEQVREFFTSATLLSLFDLPLCTFFYFYHLDYWRRNGCAHFNWVFNFNSCCRYLQ